jgi:beta-glucosidase
MNNTRISLLCLCLLLTGIRCAIAQKASLINPGDGPRVERAIDSIIAGLTLQEKIGQLVQYSGGFDTGPSGVRLNDEQQRYIKEGKAGSLLNVIGAAMTRDLQRIAVEESRAKIPLIFGLDVIHGFKTTFPIPLAEAASWDADAVELSARVGAAEASSSGIHWTFAPMVDIARDPRWGRIAEGSGEDTYLGSVMAAARVRGFQGRDLTAKTSLVACPKHFAAYGAGEGGRDYNTVDLSEQTLRDVYLPPFKAALDAGAGTFMASFNEINGIPSSGSHFLLTDVLRTEWKFDGFVVSDWNSVGEMIPHGFAADPAHAAELALNAGCDMDMESRCFRDNLEALVEKGSVKVSTIDEAVRRILRVKFRIGLFADPYKACDTHREAAELRSAANIAAARSVGRKSIVLLKNDKNLLPLSMDLKTIAVIGPLAHNHRDPVGMWAGPTDTNNVVTVLDGIKAAVPRSSVLFSPGCALNGTDTVGIAAAVAVARRADVVLLAVGESEDMTGEAYSRATLDLPGRQLDLVKAVYAAGKPVILIVMGGRPLAISWEAATIPAILEAWHLGHETGNAIADILFGVYAPTGRLPVSFPRVSGQVPIYYNHKNTGRPANDTIHYTSRYFDVLTTPLFPFGFGLTYTTFGYADLAIDRAKVGVADTIVVSVTVTNTGSRVGDEVVQLYIRDDVGRMTRPVRELKGFKRVHLEPGQSVRVPFTVAVSDLAYTGVDMKRAVEPGAFTAYVGSNAQEGLEGKFEVIK